MKDRFISCQPGLSGTRKWNHKGRALEVKNFSSCIKNCGQSASNERYESKNNYQLDLVFDREDNVITVCEMISTFGAEKSVINHGYFDRILTLEYLFKF